VSAVLCAAVSDVLADSAFTVMPVTSVCQKHRLLEDVSAYNDFCSVWWRDANAKATGIIHPEVVRSLLIISSEESFDHKALRRIHTQHAVPMPFPCHAVPLRV
jgi:hypothetical protein